MARSPMTNLIEEFQVYITSALKDKGGDIRALVNTYHGRRIAQHWCNYYLGLSMDIEVEQELEAACLEGDFIEAELAWILLELLVNQGHISTVFNYRKLPIRTQDLIRFQ